MCVDCSFNVFRNTSISMWVEITPTVQFIKMPHNITYLYTSLNGSMVGLTGNKHSLDKINLRLLEYCMMVPWSSTYCGGLYTNGLFIHRIMKFCWYGNRDLGH